MPLAAMYGSIPECYDCDVFQHLLQREINRSLRYPQFFALLLVSVDRGGREYPAGNGYQLDGFLTLVVQNIREELRETDIIGRCGDHLTVILLGTSLEGIRVAADRIRERIARFAFPPELTGGGSRMTVSVGGACFPSDGSDLISLLDAALLSLCRARETGGNRAVLFLELGGEA